MTIVKKLHSGKDNTIRSVGLRRGKNYLKRPKQLFYPMELHCNTVRNTETKLNPNVKEFRPSQPKRATAATAKVNIRDIQQEDHDF